jgi:hypothetical protein
MNPQEALRLVRAVNSGRLSPRDALQAYLGPYKPDAEGSADLMSSLAFVGLSSLGGDRPKSTCLT